MDITGNYSINANDWTGITHKVSVTRKGFKFKDHNVRFISVEPMKDNELEALLGPQVYVEWQIENCLPELSLVAPESAVQVICEKIAKEY